jgi:dTDP-4-dehydrorhamnose 3,5-epimerase
MQIKPLSISGLLLITPRRFGDDRGWFMETWNKASLEASGVVLAEFVQDNHSFSVPRYTLRGLHYQRPPCAQDKLVRCSWGRILDVAVDVRLGSPTYGQFETVELSAENGAQLFVSTGFLHGFLPLTEECEVQCKCTDSYVPDCDRAVRWDSVGIDWGVDRPILSAKDAAAPLFSEFDSPFQFGEPAS